MAGMGNLFLKKYETGFYLIIKGSCSKQKKVMARKTSPIKKEKQVKQNPDPLIDQDFPGFPHPPSQKKQITPETKTEKKVAGVDKKKKSKKTYGQ